MSKSDNKALFTLLPPFYDQPPHQDVNYYLKKIENEFSIKINKYKYLKWAFDHDVFIVNDELVFRFPRTTSLREHLKYEVAFINFLQNKFKVNIPSYTFISADLAFAGYKLIPGKTLTASAFESLSKKNKGLVIKQLIEFINSFHKIRSSDLKKFHPHEKSSYILIEEKIEKELEKKLFPRLSKIDVELIENFYKISRKYLMNAPDNCSLHGDLYGYNILWDKNQSKIGIIDFGDFLIGDPARDFEVFYDYGPKSAEMAYTIYQGTKDKEFLKRAKIYYQAHGIYTLLSSLLGADISFDYAYKYTFKRKFNF